MQYPKISLITVSYNAQDTIIRCIESVLSQSYNNIEYIIIDGNSTDNTVRLIGHYKEHISIMVSEPDGGIYDAMNKGIKIATGDIIGILNADDVFAHPDVLANVAKTFETQSVDIVYGNLNYINPQGEIIRKWNSGTYKKGAFNWGWMPPHPTFYCKRELFGQFGFYDTEFGTAGDYELMVRFMHLNNINTYYLDEIIVNMNIGGLSNLSYGNRVKAWGFDLKAMRKNGVLFPLMAIIFKPLRKINQYL